jgi:hypothetical protein
VSTATDPLADPPCAYALADATTTMNSELRFLFRI